MLKVETSYISNLSGKEFQSSRAPRLTHLIQSNQQNNIGLLWYMFSFSFSFPGFFQLFKLNFETCLNFFFFFKFCLAPYFLTRFQFYFYFIFYCYPTTKRGREKRVVDIYNKKKNWWDLRILFYKHENSFTKVFSKQAR